MKKRLMAAVAVATASLIALGGCTAGSSSSAKADNGDKKDISMVVVQGWAEDAAVSEIWKQVLDKRGYDVQFKSLAVGPTYASLAKGELDINMDAWLPTSQAAYWKKYGKHLDDLGAWYKYAPETIAVNKSAPIDSLSELAANADKFDNEIIGIEAGTGEMQVVQDDLVPAYGLQKMKVVTSSSTAMLAALKKAVTEHKNIVVTLWRPHWAYAAFPIKDLKDPKHAWGKANHIDTVVRKGFTSDYPTLTKWLKNFRFPPKLLSDLENKMFNSGAKPDQYPAIVKKWLAAHPSFTKSLTQG